MVLVTGALRGFFVLLMDVVMNFVAMNETSPYCLTNKKKLTNILGFSQSCNVL